MIWNLFLGFYHLEFQWTRMMINNRIICLWGINNQMREHEAISMWIDREKALITFENGQV